MILDEDVEDVGSDRNPGHISVMTTEYIVSGLDDQAYPAFEAAEDARVGEAENTGISLMNAVVRPLGYLKSPPRAFPCWRIPSMEVVVAILADDVPAQESLLEIWRDFRVPFRAMIYAGQFLIEGTFYSEDEDPPEFTRQTFRPIEDATITGLMGGGIDEMQIKLGLVNLRHIHGFNAERM
jgi:hypothetical protein